MRLEPLYRATFTTPEAWSVELAGPAGTEGQSFLIAEGRCDGRLRGANYPRRLLLSQRLACRLAVRHGQFRGRLAGYRAGRLGVPGEAHVGH